MNNSDRKGTRDSQGVYDRHLGTAIFKTDNPPAMQEKWCPSLGRQDPLEKEKATYSSILA